MHTFARARRACFVLLSLVIPPTAAIAQPVRAGGVSGVVRDAQGTVLPNVPVDVACGFLRAHVQTDSSGAFTFSGLPAGPCVISSRAMLLAAAEARVMVKAGSTATVDLALAVRGFGDAVSITAARGDAEERFASPQFTSVLTANEIGMQPYYLLPQALRDQPGVLLQQTTTAQASPILRGFTGQSNVYLVDGVRFNVSTWRPGPSQYMAWINSAVADRIESSVAHPACSTDPIRSAVPSTSSRSPLTSAPEVSRLGARSSSAQPPPPGAETGRARFP
jgi:hypothetical protein